MTNKQLVQEYLERRGLQRVGGEGDIEPLLPLIIMDAEMQIFDNIIAPLKIKHETKKIRNDWKEAFRNFQTEYLSNATMGFVDNVIDKMDDFGSYINNELMITKVKIMDAIPFIEFDTRNVMTSCLLCNILAQSAQIIYVHQFKKRNPYLLQIQNLSHNFMNRYYVIDQMIDLNKQDTICVAVDRLCKRIVGWLNEDSQMKIRVKEIHQ